NYGQNATPRPNRPERNSFLLSCARKLLSSPTFLLLGLAPPGCSPPPLLTTEAPPQVLPRPTRAPTRTAPTRPALPSLRPEAGRHHRAQLPRLLCGQPPPRPLLVGRMRKGLHPQMQWISYVTQSGRLINIMMTKVNHTGKVYHMRAKRQMAQSLGQIAKFKRRYEQDAPEENQDKDNAV
ncbi:hypothetical protein CFC21_078355, partial [Triticum aestivum]|uniref:Uncharacterized protein n=2 Tax=Triticum aestivum TaxID=4565 RepID=A0A3B6MVL8_WHEAT